VQSVVTSRGRPSAAALVISHGIIDDLAAAPLTVRSAHTTFIFASGALDGAADLRFSQVRVLCFLWHRFG